MDLHSEQIDQLAIALAKAQSEIESADKNKVNGHYKNSYADLEVIVNSSRPYLVKNGLSVIQSLFEIDGSSYLITMLMHSSGQWIKSKARHKPLKDDVQSLASYNTYLRRMCYASLIGVVAGDEDDDGEDAVSQKINLEQQDRILKLPPEKIEKIFKHFKVRYVEDIDLRDYEEIAKTYKWND